MSDGARVDGNPDFCYDDAHVDRIAQSIYDAYRAAAGAH